MMDLTVIWFILIVVLFTGFFILEGFDYGVGGLMPFLSDDTKERGEILRTITPVWDGNEVWMITAGGAMFAAFPHVYATMFSAFYLALFLMLVALILRGVAFDLRGRHESVGWQKFWDRAICFGSVVPAFLWGVAVTDLIAGIPTFYQLTYSLPAKSIKSCFLYWHTFGNNWNKFIFLHIPNTIIIIHHILNQWFLLTANSCQTAYYTG